MYLESFCSAVSVYGCIAIASRVFYSAPIFWYLRTTYYIFRNTPVKISFVCTILGCQSKCNKIDSGRKCKTVENAIFASVSADAADCSYAVYTKEAENAGNAEHAEHAYNALYSKKARFAKEAVNSTIARKADNATYAYYAEYAVSAKYFKKVSYAKCICPPPPLPPPF